jgi:hypothetical protein
MQDTWLGCIEGGRLHVSQGVVTCTELLALLASLGGVFSGDLPAHLSVESEELPASPHLLVGISWYSTEPTTIQVCEDHDRHDTCNFSQRYRPWVKLLRMQIYAWPHRSYLTCDKKLYTRYKP